MTIASEIERLQGAKSDLITAINTKGASLTSSTSISTFADTIDSQPTVYTGTGDPSASLGKDGDVYIKENS